MLFPVESVPPGPPIETKKALLLLDFQNDFVSPEGNLSVPNVQAFLPLISSLVTEFRAKGEVIWVGTEYKHSRSTVSSTTGSHSILLKQFLRNHESIDETSEYINDPGHTRSPAEDPLSPSSKIDVIHDREAFLAPVMTMTRHRCCMPGSSGAEYPGVIKEAMDLRQDLVLLKSHYSAFVDTPLLMHLRTRTITELYICGSISNVSVYATVLDAVCHGLRVTVIEDLLGYNDEKCHVEAMRQMADDMGANGVDCQELRDDLAGLLGDVVLEEEFTARFQVSLPPPARKTVSHTSREHINNWISQVDTENMSHTDSYQEAGKHSHSTVESGGIPSKRSEEATTDGHDSYAKSESSRISVKPTSIEQSPPRKRPTSDLESLEEDRVPKLSHKPSTRRTSNAVYLAEQLKQKQTKQPTTRKRRPSHESSIGSLTPTTNTTMMPSQSIENCSGNIEGTSENDHAPAEDVTPEEDTVTRPMGPKKKKKLTPNALGPGDKIGRGDCQIFMNLLSVAEADAAFYSCRKLIKWQKMFHRSGEVPRLVAVQGTVLDGGTEIPIYRHPADESPELLPFDPVVDVIRQAAEKVVGHPLNHVLIQWYRNSEDNISEHSDKTLDIVRGSSIVNVSLGAQRTMTLRTKKSAIASLGENLGDSTRPSQRIPLPHNSIFVLGQETNQHWLHAIRADKRPPSEKDLAELAFDCERISLTFRHIGTFINPTENTIWGQGGTSKRREDPKQLLKGAEAEKEGESMIRAFGQENHRSTDWDWDQWYGGGFDVVNFETKNH